MENSYDSKTNKHKYNIISLQTKIIKNKTHYIKIHFRYTKKKKNQSI